MAELPQDATLADVILWAVASQAETKSARTALWKAIKALEDSSKTSDDRIRGLDKTMITREDVTTAVDRAEGRTAGKIEALGNLMDRSMETITKSLDEIPEQAKQIMALETKMAQPESSGVSSRTMGTLVGALLATLAACAAAVRSIWGGGE